MLTRLNIQNVVLIEQCDLQFSAGLGVLTGETGAGKSILLDALGLALGLRSDARMLRAGATQASVTAEFTLDDAPDAQQILKDLDIAMEDELILRRTLAADGKTRCFINDQPVSVTALKSVGDALLEVHGQHDQRGLLNTRTHLDTLDVYGELGAQVKTVELSYRDWKSAENALAALHQEMATIRAEHGYLQFIEKELSEIRPKQGEEETLASKRTFMMQSEKLAQLLQDVMKELKPPQKPMSAALGTVERMLSRTALNADNKFKDVIEHIERAQNDIAEAEQKLEVILESCAYDPQRLEQIEERLFALRGLARKHNMQVDELPALLVQVSEKLKAIDTRSAREAELKAAVDKAKAIYKAASEKLSAKRKQIAKKLETALLKELAPLKMGSVGFRVEFEALPEEQWHKAGTDSVRFEAATNKGSEFAPLHKIASGGELSRFMLALKVVLAEIRGAPVLIFDEIDAGTGGAVADAIGERLALLGKSHQVFVVTHLPQVAAKGNSHMRVQKEEKKGHTFTKVETLGKAERTEELARMLAGAEITAEARKAAQRLMKAS